MALKIVYKICCGIDVHKTFIVACIASTNDKGVTSYEIYQSAFGKEVYSSVEEKAANLLYFMIKDHPYVDGCKRIAASLFLEFLDKNGVLFQNGIKRLSDGVLVAITLMIAESKPEEKDVMVKLVMNILNL